MAPGTSRASPRPPRPVGSLDPAPQRLLWSAAQLQSLPRSRPMSFHSLVATAPLSLNTNGLVSYLQGLFGPLFLGIVGIVALFFLFTREIIRFVQFVVLAVAIAVIFYTPSIVQTLAQGIAKALGVH